ncbi:hypothetical protein M3647_06825 [Paenibacillus cellulositrophicus]|uniref:hypothetical protein n=1 Tax=Paenibacillus cellulositrophicus TaxID=562959 RepID=UPI0020409A34|nr:hypothetical protein [Paenibacillus cellulositrophicus]MCM2997179.1 hypothetical protein [Paenibacillus cellulositrophicus]
MNNLVREVVESFYHHEDKLGYLLRCQSTIELPSVLMSFLNNNNIKLQPFNTGDVWPSCKWIFIHENYCKGEFRVSYSSVLMVSKLAPLYYLHHEFQVDNKDEQKMSPTLDGFDEQPYTRTQAELESIIEESFKKLGYEQLSYKEMNEVLQGIQFGDDVGFFGQQVTVEYALFHDVLEICPD